MIIPAELIFKELFTLEFYCLSLSLLVLAESPGRLEGGEAETAGEGSPGGGTGSCR